jgi:TolB protein
MKFRNTLLLCVVLIFINSHCVTDAPVEPIKETYTVEGFVTDSETGEPIDSVLVRAIFTFPDNEFPLTYTDAQGYYSLFLDDRKGINIIEFEKEGYRSEKREFEIGNKPGKNSIIRIDVQLTSVSENGPCPPFLPPPIYPGTYGAPAWHPDGMIMFNWVKILKIDLCTGGVNDQDIDYDSSGVWMINPDGTGLRKLLPYGYGLDSPAWSPDGRWIAFGVVHIYKMRFTGINFDTTTVVQLTTEGRNFFPAWSPDGEWIAYRRSYSYPESPTVQGIWITRSNGEEQKQVFSGNSGEPTWHPSGLHLAFFRGVTDESGHVLGDSLWVFNLETQSLERITFLSGDNRHPRYSPDGSEIAFWSQSSGDVGNLWIMDTDGSNPFQLTTAGAGEFSWSPDGSQIVFVQHDARKAETQNGTLWIMNSDGSNKRQLTFNYDLRFEP